MSTTLYSEFLQDILPDVPGAADVSIEDAVKVTAIELCRKASIWKERLMPDGIFSGVDVYDLFSPSREVIVHRIEAAFYRGRKLTVKQYGEINAWREAALVVANSIAANEAIPADVGYVPPITDFYAQQSPTQIVLYGMPDGNYPNALLVDAVLLPSRASTGFDSVLAERYWDYIVHGAKSRLMLIPNKPWSDAGTAAFHKGQFDNEVANATGDASQGFGSAPVRVKVCR